MSEQHIKYHHNFKSETPSTIIIREGSAPKVYDPEQVELAGVITAPAEYLGKRPELVPTDCSHVIFNKRNRSILLIVDEKSHFKTSIIGVLEKDEFLKSLHINSTTSYTIADLAKALRFARRHFASPDDHNKLLLRLRNFTAKITQETKQTDDRAGNKMQSFESKVSEFSTANELGFVLRRPIFKGLEKQNINIRIEIDVNNGQVALYLVCDELEEMEDALLESIFSEQKAVFEKYVCVEQ